MIPLRRLLKKKVLAPVLDEARAMLGTGWRLTVTEEPCPDTAAAGGCVEPLHFEAAVVGYLNLMPLPDAESDCAGLAPGLPRFVAGCLEAMLANEAVRRSLANETLQKYREVSLLHRASLGLNGSLRPRDVATALIEECRRDEIPADMGMVFLYSRQTDCFAPVSFFGDAAGSRLADVSLSTLFWDVARTQKGEIVNDLVSDQRWRGEAALRSLIIAPLVAANRCVGMLIVGKAALSDRFEASHLQYVTTITTVAGIALGNALHFERIQTLIDSLMQALATAIDARDPFTAGHSQRVARLGVALAKVVHQDQRFFPQVRFSVSDLEELLYAGLLHDVGKIGVREEVLTKATRISVGEMEVIGQRLALVSLTTGEDCLGHAAALARINAADVISREDAALIVRLAALSVQVGERSYPVLTEREMRCLLIARGNLTPDERREIERHPAESQRILQHIPFPDSMGRLLDIISQHHERLDGSGYPQGLKDAEILLQSRIIAIVDIYDAITMARHYKPALPRQKALGILWQEAEAGRIDARLVELLDGHIEAVERDVELFSSRLDLSDYLERRTPATVVS